jgi:hypothetical protein
MRDRTHRHAGWRDADRGGVDRVATSEKINEVDAVIENVGDFGGKDMPYLGCPDFASDNADPGFSWDPHLRSTPVGFLH